MIISKDEVCAILPLVNTGKVWVSLPHFSYGGILFEEKCTGITESDIINSIISKIISSELSSGFYSYCIDGKQDWKEYLSQKFFVRTLSTTNDEKFSKTKKVISLLELPDSIEALSNKLNTNLKRKIRKAKKLEITIKSGGVELLDDFYSVYSRNIFELRSLNYGKKFIEDLFSTYKFGNIKIFVAYLNNSPIGSSLIAGYNGFYENMFFATSLNSRKYYVSDLLHWEMICYSIKNEKLSKTNSNGVYSFGRSTYNSGVHKYKSHWPIIDYPIYHYSNMQDIRKHSKMLNIWGKLPYFISSPLGAKLIKHIY